MERFSIHACLFFWSSNLKHIHSHGNRTFKHLKTWYEVNQSWGPGILTLLRYRSIFGCRWCQCWLGLNLKVQCTVGVARGHHITGGFAEWHGVTWSDMKWHEVTWNAHGISHHFTSFQRFRVFYGVLQLCSQISWFAQWFSLSKPPLSREESDFLVWRVLLIWKRAETIPQSPWSMRV